MRPGWPTTLNRCVWGSDRHRFPKALPCARHGLPMDVETSKAGCTRPAEPDKTVRMDQRATSARSKAPVFVLGSVRSGTTLLYHMLLSSGGFAVYRTESHAINLLEPRF